MEREEEKDRVRERGEERKQAILFFSRLFFKHIINLKELLLKEQ